MFTRFGGYEVGVWEVGKLRAGEGECVICWFGYGVCSGRVSVLAGSCPLLSSGVGEHLRCCGTKYVGVWGNEGR